MVPFSRRVLEKKFKKETGTSIYQYLQELRIEKFADLLITTDLPLVEAAAKSGFTDYKNISRIFIKTKEMTPFQYRKHFTPKNK
ncbi:helix-turn-helix domain-containing protein [Parabacteroides sp. ASF519]|nr:helix-turn-helix domain-containing protein [Parabacteroides sp. ASF519]